MTLESSERREASPPESSTRCTRVAILNNFIPPYWKPVFACLADRIPHLRVLVSTPMEPNRAWEVDWQGLDVVLQKTITVRGKWRHPKGFEEPLFIHLPVDTIAQLNRFRAEVVLSAEMGFRTLLSLGYRKLHSRSRLIIWAEIAESTERGRGLLRRVLRTLLAKHADAFIVFGNSGARYVQTLRVPNSKIFQVPYATDVKRFATTPLTRTGEQIRRLLYVGQLIDRKGLLPFIEVLSRWALAHSERRIEFLLAGDGPLGETLKRVAHPPNLTIELLGNVDYERLPPIYDGCGVFVFPTLADTWGLVVNEAMASGLPVLGSCYSQAVEMIVTDGENGWTFEPDDAGQTYGAIDRCMNTSDEAFEKMRERARTAAIKNTPQHVATLIDDAVMACLGGNMGKEENHAAA